MHAGDRDVGLGQLLPLDPVLGLCPRPLLGVPLAAAGPCRTWVRLSTKNSMARMAVFGVGERSRPGGVSRRTSVWTPASSRRPRHRRRRTGPPGRLLHGSGARPRAPGACWLMDEFRIEWTVGRGTTVVMRRDGLPAMPADGWLEWEVRGRPLPGEQVSGDTAVVTTSDTLTLLTVIDGLGHGPEAAAASEVAMGDADRERVGSAGTVVGAVPPGPPHDTGRGHDHGCGGPCDGAMQWLGVGDVEGVLVRGDRGTAATAGGGITTSPESSGTACRSSVSTPINSILATSWCWRRTASPPRSSTSSAPPQPSTDWRTGIVASHARAEDDAVGARRSPTPSSCAAIGGRARESSRGRSRWTDESSSSSARPQPQARPSPESASPAQVARRPRTHRHVMSRR